MRKKLAICGIILLIFDYVGLFLAYTNGLIDSNIMIIVITGLILSTICFVITLPMLIFYA